VNGDVRVINEMVRSESGFVDEVLHEVDKVIVGQRQMVERVLLGMLTGGHVLLEGVPGLAKTLTVNTLAATMDAQFQRIQFTPDLLPADLIGTLIYNPRSGEFTPKKGPIFANIILADEINRAPAKVQSALLEAMQEKQVTIGDTTYPLGRPFLVMATQNPIDQEGTYPLPEAQIDRFMMLVKVGYPGRDEEREIIARQLDPTPQLVTCTFACLIMPIKNRNGGWEPIPKRRPAAAEISVLSPFIGHRPHPCLTTGGHLRTGIHP